MIKDVQNKEAANEHIFQSISVPEEQKME